MADKQEFGIGLIGLGIGQQHLLGYQLTGHSLPTRDAIYSTRTRRFAFKARKELSTGIVMI